MKYKIEGQKEKIKVEKEVTISLELSSDGIVSITGIDEDGLIWYLLELQKDGTFRRNKGVSDSIGFQVNKNGRIKESKE